MKKELKGFIVGVTITSILSFGFSGLADTTWKTIDVAVNSINLKVNGKAVTTDNFVYDGTTYVPLRAVGDMLGKNIVWDDTTKTAEVNDKDYVESSNNNQKNEKSNIQNSSQNPSAKIDNVSLKGIKYPTTNPTTTKILTGKATAAYIIVDAKDQYGNTLNTKTALDADVLIVKSDKALNLTTEDYIDNDGSKQVRIDVDTTGISNNETVTVTAVSKLTGKSSSINLDIKNNEESNTQNSRQNPFDIGKNNEVSMRSNDGTTFRANLCINQIIRGDEAWNRIKEANQFNDSPKDGYEYMLVDIKFSLIDSTDINTQFNLSRYNFALVSSEGKDYENASVVTPDPQLDSNLYKGASNEGWIAFQVKKDDEHPLIAYLKSYDGKSGFWFKGYNDSKQINENINQNASASNNDTITALVDNVKISSKEDLLNYLNNKFSKLNTCIGETNFTFNIDENTSLLAPYDYWIQVGYDYNFFDGAMSSIKYTKEQKAQLKEQLKDFQELLAKTIIAKIPNKKIQGGYFDSWYKYPSLQLDLITRYYYTWINFDYTGNPSYDNAKLSNFKWDTSMDSKFLDDSLNELNNLTN